MTTLIPILGLFLLILIHEAGHFLVAKAVGARATKFYLGFPPAVLRRRVRDTEYGLGAIPLGGYVRIVGMTRPQATDLLRVQDAAEEAALRRPGGELDELTPAVRDLSAALTAGNLDRVPALVEPAQAALAEERERLHGRTYEQARKDLERLVEETDPRAYWRLAVWRRVAIIFAGPFANLLAAVLILAAYYLSGIPVVESRQPVQVIQPGSPAQTAGLRPGDTVVAVNGTRVSRPAEVTQAIQGANGAEITLRVRRDGQERTLEPVEPRRTDGRWLVGFGFDVVQVGTERVGPVDATTQAVGRLGDGTVETLKAMSRLVRGQNREELTTVVGIVDQSRATVDAGYFPGVLAFISLALAIFNLLPFLPLDGGHIVVALAEKLRGGRPVPRVVLERVSVLGIALMLMLFVVGLSNDIGRLTQP